MCRWINSDIIQRSSYLWIGDQTEFSKNKFGITSYISVFLIFLAAYYYSWQCGLWQRRTGFWTEGTSHGRKHTMGLSKWKPKNIFMVWNLKVLLNFVLWLSTVCARVYFYLLDVFFIFCNKSNGDLFSRPLEKNVHIGFHLLVDMSVVQPKVVCSMSKELSAWQS